MAAPPGLLCRCAVVLFLGAAPSCAAARVEVQGPHAVVGYRSVHALFYVVPVDGGVVLVDSGFDPTGADVRAALSDRAVKAVLLTHSHVDHWSGLQAVGDAPVYASALDAATMRGERHHSSPINHIVDHQWPRPALPAVLRTVADGAVVRVGTESFTAHIVRGHTAGSVVWQWRDVLFTGDALLGDGDGVGVSPALVSDDVRASQRSITRLWGLDVHTLLDGHSGRTDDVVPKVNALLKVQGTE